MAQNIPQSVTLEAVSIGELKSILIMRHGQLPVTLGADL
jgi:hypothetical protein